VRENLLELAEEPGLLIPLTPPSDLIVGNGYCMVTSTRSASVERLRLEDGGVEPTVEEVRGLAREHGFTHTTWWVGELSTPGDLADRLEALGLGPDDDLPQMTSFTLSSAPAGEQAVEVRRVETLEAYLRGLEIDFEVWDLPENEREEQLARYRRAWPEIARDDRVVHFLACLDGKAVGMGRAVYTALGAVLLGGSVLPEARGRGAYLSLVHARWDEAVDRGTPRVTVSAGPMSAPILQRLGFERIGSLRLLRDRL
jgi:hypothetical protein